MSAARSPYPTSPVEVDAWAADNKRPLVEAQRRYAHYLALRSLADDPRLARAVVVHGGAVASYVFDSGRTPNDIDLYVRGRQNNAVSEPERQELIRQTSTALSIGTRKFCPQFQIWRERLREFIKVELYGPAVPFFESTIVVDPAHPAVTVQVTDLASTIAGKYLALTSREAMAGLRTSAQKDTFDLASVILRQQSRIDLPAVRRCFTSDPQPRWATLPTAQIFTRELRNLAEQSYIEKIKPMTGDRFIEFPDAWRIVTEYFDVLR
jgi:hypothetical protein